MPQSTSCLPHPSRRITNDGQSRRCPKKPLSKTELLANLATATDLSKKQVAAVLEALAAEIKTSLGNRGAGAITIPGLLKIEKNASPPGPPRWAFPIPSSRVS